ncbi:MAG TPA: ATP synthase F0 subunit B [Enhygromyxa sp.]|nr:ATP synthase F0 subunit B [Enhygromyxa sp.]
MRSFIKLAAFAVVWLAPVLALASPPHGKEHATEHGAEHAEGIKWLGDGFLGGPGADGRTGYLIMLINFVALLLILNKILFKNLRSSNAEASDAVRLELERATKARSEAEALFREYETKLQALETEVADIRAAAKLAAEAEFERIVAEAREQAGKIEQAAIRAGEREALRRRTELENEIAESALARAEAAIRSTFAPGDQRRLVDAWIDEVGKTDINSQTGTVN